MDTYKVGELARRTGLTVRALHHYHQIGLLVPGRASASGHRLYTLEDLARLHRITAMRALGFSLEQIRLSLSCPEPASASLVRMQLARVQQQIALLQTLAARLQELSSRLDTGGGVETETFLKMMEVTVMTTKFPFTEQQLELLKVQAERLGPETIRAVELEWPDLIRAVQGELDRGTPPTDPVVTRLAERWRELLAMFTGGDAAIASSLAQGYRENPVVGRGLELSPALLAYVGKAMAKEM